MIVLLAAVDEGLGACFVAALRDREVQRVSRLPSDVRPTGIIPIGY
jgi:nitroreductase